MTFHVGVHVLHNTPECSGSYTDADSNRDGSDDALTVQPLQKSRKTRKKGISPAGLTSTEPGRSAGDVGGSIT